MTCFLFTTGISTPKAHKRPFPYKDYGETGKNSMGHMITVSGMPDGERLTTLNVYGEGMLKRIIAAKDEVRLLDTHRTKGKLSTIDLGQILLAQSRTDELAARMIIINQKKQKGSQHLGRETKQKVINENE